MKRLKSKRGSGLVDFLVVIGVCAVLAAYHFTSTNGTLKNSLSNLSNEYTSKDTVVIE